MIIRKMWLLRTGKIIAGSYEEADWTDISLDNVRYYFLEITKVIIHRTVLVSLKAWILFTNLIRKYDKKVKTKLTHVIHKNSQYKADENQKPSEFLSNIKDHRDKVMGEIEKE
ncbi:MAG: hypothetical protein WCO65_03395 [bacterium]